MIPGLGRSPGEGIGSVQFSSVTQLCPTLCDSLGCSMPDFPVHHQLSELTQTHVHRAGDAIQPSPSSVVPFCSCPQSLPASGSFPMSQFSSGGQEKQWIHVSVQFSSVTQSCLTLCDPMDCSTPGLPVHHQLPEFTQTHVHRVGGAIQPSHPLSSPSPPAPNPSQHQSLFQ